jgi:hypothetical protein
MLYIGDSLVFQDSATDVGDYMTINLYICSD